MMRQRQIRHQLEGRRDEDVKYSSREIAPAQQRWMNHPGMPRPQPPRRGPGLDPTLRPGTVGPNQAPSTAIPPAPILARDVRDDPRHKGHKLAVELPSAYCSDRVAQRALCA